MPVTTLNMDDDPELQRLVERFRDAVRGATDEERERAWFRITDQALINSDDMQESLGQMHRGEGREVDPSEFLRTKGGVELTPDAEAELAVEAEAGLDVDELRPHRRVWLVGEFDEMRRLAFSTEERARLFVEYRVRKDIVNGFYGEVPHDVPLTWREGEVGFPHSSFGKAYDWLAASAWVLSVELDDAEID